MKSVLRDDRVDDEEKIDADDDDDEENIDADDDVKRC